MFEATTKGSFLLTDAADTCDVLEEAVNLALEGRPGPSAHPRPREPHLSRRLGGELPRHPAVLPEPAEVVARAAAFRMRANVGPATPEQVDLTAMTPVDGEANLAFRQDSSWVVDRHEPG
jgi:hypothetical protein